MKAELKRIADSLKTESLLLALALKKATPADGCDGAQRQDIEEALCFLAKAISKIELVQSDLFDLEDK